VLLEPLEEPDDFVEELLEPELFLAWLTALAKLLAMLPIIENGIFNSPLNDLNLTEQAFFW